MARFSKTTALLALISLAATCGCHRGVSVTIENAAPSPIGSITLVFTGGSKSWTNLGVGKSVTAHVNPTGESDLLLEVREPAGHTNDSYADVYLENGYHGAIVATIGPSNMVTWNVKSLSIY